MSVLDRPIWSSLSGRHAELAEGGADARRYRPDINVFAACRDDADPACHAALAALVAPGEAAFLLQVPANPRPVGFAVEREALGVQMIGPCEAPLLGEGEAVIELGDADAADMQALARLTEPGPFLPRTHRMGRFLGVRRDGRLLAMAGERLRPAGWTEISGVCCHPDARGQGLARRLSAAVLSRILARGEQAFLHAWRSNTAAIALYESLGFRLRAEVQVAVLRRV